MREIEQNLFNKGITAIAGIDEAGRGPLAGPVVAAAAILPFASFTAVIFSCPLNFKYVSGVILTPVRDGTL